MGNPAMQENISEILNTIKTGYKSKNCEGELNIFTGEYRDKLESILTDWIK
jgi:hypothetical protein